MLVNYRVSNLNNWSFMLLIYFQNSYTLFSGSSEIIFVCCDCFFSTFFVIFHSFYWEGKAKFINTSFFTFVMAFIISITFLFLLCNCCLFIIGIQFFMAMRNSLFFQNNIDIQNNMNLFSNLINLALKCITLFELLCIFFQNAI